MSKLKLTTNPKVEEVFANYRHFVRDKIQRLRELVIETAEETVGISIRRKTSYSLSIKSGNPCRRIKRMHKSISDIS